MKPDTPQARRVERMGTGVFIAVAVLMLVVIGGQFYSRRLSPAAQAAHRFLQEMPVDRIQEVVLEPYTVHSLVAQPLHLRRRETIARLAALLRTARPWSPSHPNARWFVILRLVTAQGDYGGHVESTDNDQGVQIWYASGVHGGWNFGTYRQDALGPLLEQLAAEAR